MPSDVRATFVINGWDEEPFDDAGGGAKLTRASVTREYSGDVEGDSATEWLMAYQLDESAAFVGVERIRGTIGGRRGSLVLQHVGTFADGVATAVLTVVSGTDELQGATGSGEFVADPSGRIRLSVQV
jgi:hypothetical protein